MLVSELRREIQCRPSKNLEVSKVGLIQVCLQLDWGAISEGGQLRGEKKLLRVRVGCLAQPAEPAPRKE